MKFDETQTDLDKAVRLQRHGLWLLPRYALPGLIELDDTNADAAAVLALVFTGTSKIEVHVNGVPSGYAMVGTEGSLLMELDSAAALYARLRQIFIPGNVSPEVHERWTMEVTKAAEEFTGAPVECVVGGAADDLTPEMFGAPASDAVQPPAETQSSDGCQHPNHPNFDDDCLIRKQQGYRNAEREETE